VLNTQNCRSSSDFCHTFSAIRPSHLSNYKTQKWKVTSREAEIIMTIKAHS